MAYYDEFVFQARITDTFKPNERIYFPVIQTGEVGENLWIEIPNKKQSKHDLKKPAPSIKAIENK